MSVWMLDKTGRKSEGGEERQTSGHGSVSDRLRTRTSGCDVSAPHTTRLSGQGNRSENTVEMLSPYTARFSFTTYKTFLCIVLVQHTGRETAASIGPAGQYMYGAADLSDVNEQRVFTYVESFFHSYYVQD